MQQIGNRKRKNVRPFTFYKAFEYEEDVSHYKGVNLRFKIWGMEETKRQKQVGRMLEEELTEIFRKKGWNIMGNGMISIMRVRVTPDLAEAKIYISMFQIDDKETMLAKIEKDNWEVRRELGTRIKNNVRKIPTLAFFDDDTLDYVAKIDAVLERIKKSDEEK